MEGARDEGSFLCRLMPKGIWAGLHRGRRAWCASATHWFRVPLVGVWLDKLGHGAAGHAELWPLRGCEPAGAGWQRVVLGMGEDGCGLVGGDCRHLASTGEAAWVLLRLATMPPVAGRSPIA